MWRWSYRSISYVLHMPVFSTYVEMILYYIFFVVFIVCILHVCGDDPCFGLPARLYASYSPRMWRWSPYPTNAPSTIIVFSTYVEMILKMTTYSLIYTSILHVCGDDPIASRRHLKRTRYSPRMWRWSYYHPTSIHNCLVFSTYVEMILPRFVLLYPSFRILHVCGGDPTTFCSLISIFSYSPRMWRWSSYQVQTLLLHRVFSTYVEMILHTFVVYVLAIRILHVCGDDPKPICNSAKTWWYSPRMWRWSCILVLKHLTFSVFSTYVEMILSLICTNTSVNGILHVCGDDPKGVYWDTDFPVVFSTYVEMIL